MSQYVTTNGIRLHYRDSGGAGAPLVLIPGLTANCYAFDGLAAAGLVPRLRLITLDMRGRGASDKPESGYMMADHAADVAGLLQALGLERAVIGGHSFGGMLAMYMAANYPALVERIILIDAAIAVAHPRTRELIKPALDRLEQSYPSFEAFLALIRQAPYFSGWQWDPMVESFYRHDVEEAADGSVHPRSRPAHIAQVMEGVIGEPWRAHLAKISQPALMIHALGPYGPPGAPPIVSKEQADETRNLLPDCRYVQVSGNHMTMLLGEGAAAAAAAILEFMEA